MGWGLLKIASIEKSERPREKAFEKGMGRLSDAELLALVLSSGGESVGVLDIASALLDHFGGLPSLSSCPYLLFEREKGIGRAKSSLLGACFELGRRAGAKRPGRRVEEEVEKDLWGRREEALYAYFLNPKEEVEGKRLLLLGGVSSLKGSKRAVFSSLLYAPKGEVLLVHCHPSGVALPSKEDVLFASSLSSFAASFGIKVKDHWIVSENGRFSFSENGLLKGL